MKTLPRSPTWTLLALLAILLWLPGTPRATADEDASRPQLETRLFPVGSLVAGRLDYGREREPDGLAHEASDEARPLFGWVSEERFFPVGWIDELIELMHASIEPWSWEEREGAGMWTLGGNTLVARNTPDVLDALGRTLADLQASHGQLVRVEIHAVRLDEEGRRRLQMGDAAAILGLLASEDAGPGTTILALSGMRAASFSGAQMAFVADADVEVAQTAQISDPIVQVANLGLMVDVRAIPRADGESVLLGLNAALALEPEARTMETGETGTLQMPVFPILRVHSAVTVEPGTWRLLDGRFAHAEAPGYGILVRATPLPPSPAPGGPLGTVLPSAAESGEGDYALRRYPIAHLAAPVSARRGETVQVMPSNYTPPEPRELAEPAAAIEAEAVVELLRQVLGEALWEDPAAMEVRNQTLIVRLRPSGHALVETVLDRLRSGLLWQTEVSLQVIEAEGSLGRELAGRSILDDATTQALANAAANGRIRVVDAARITSLLGRRNALTAGRHVRYVCDYEVEIAQEARIANPIVIQLLEGLVADIRAARTPDAAGVQLEVEFTRSELHEMGKLRTPHEADVELPRLGVERIRTAVMAAWDRPMILATWSGEGRTRLLIATARRR